MPYQPPHRLTDKTVQYINRGHGKLRIRKNTFNKHYQQTWKEQIKKEKCKHKAEEVNWNISMRVMYWYIKSHLEAAYLLQSSNTAAFLPDLAGKDEKQTLKDIVIPHISDIQKLAALPAAPIIIDQEEALSSELSSAPEKHSVKENTQQ